MPIITPILQLQYAFSASGNPALLRKPTWNIKPEQVKAFELGYRSS
jgi:hypothetical protein